MKDSGKPRIAATLKVAAIRGLIHLIMVQRSQYRLLFFSLYFQLYHVSDRGMLKIRTLTIENDSGDL